MKTNVMQPGFLVALKTSVRGGVAYARVDLDVDVDMAEKAKRWETTRVIESPDEYAAAKAARAKASNEVRRVCSLTSFGLLCPLKFEKELDAAIQRACDVVEAHNQTAKHTTIAVYVLKGRIAETDEEATRAIASEVGELLTGMSSAIDRLDAEAVREAAKKAREVMDMLSDEQGERVGRAIEEARKAARAIVARIEKKGEVAATVLASLDRSALNEARIAFLDMEERDHEPAPAAPMPAVDVNRIAGLGDGEVW